MSQNALQNISLEIAAIYDPLRHLDSPERITAFFKDLGYELPGGQLFAGLPAMVQSIDDLIKDVEQLANANTDDEKWKAVAKLLAAIVVVVTKIKDAVDVIKSGAASITNFATNSDIDELPGRLLDYLLSCYLRQNLRQTYGVLFFVGLLDEIDMPQDTGKFQPAFTLHKIWWERLPKYFTEPQNLPETIYKWESGFDSRLFLSRLYVLLSGFRLPGGLYPQSVLLSNALGNTTGGGKELRMPIFENAGWPNLYSQFGINISPVEAKGSDKPGFAIVPYVYGESGFDFDISDKLEIVFEISASIDGGIGLVFRPNSGIRFLDNLFSAPLDSINAGISLEVKPKKKKEEIILIGSPGASRLSIEGMHGKVFVSKTGEIDFGFEIGCDALRLIVSGGDGDGFISKILGDGGITAEVGFGLGLSKKGGLYFTGSGGLEIQLPTHIELGPLEIKGLIIALKLQEKNLVLESGATIKLELGPLVGVVENIGLTSTLSFQTNGGNLGFADLSFGFKPPNGVGLSIDADVVKGAGYLFIDAEKGEYAGALELTISDFLALKAIGLIATKMPDGSKGFSLLIIITAEFTIQLGYGFVFLGAGGLLGLNRTAKITPLAEGVRSGATANILFPTNVVENAPQIISDIKVFFPIEENHFLIGPMIKLGWGQPALISISLGVIIEIRTSEGGALERIVILGVLKCILPEEESSILVLQVNFIGAIDFTTKTAFFFASIFESRVLCITIEGEMGVLVVWGDDANFIISVGGFHPRFNPPPLPFPVPDRVSLNILNKSWGKIRVEGYFAVTTNTVQFGAKIEVYFGADDFKIEGYLAFDALFQFNPFYMIIEISGNVSLKVFGFDMFTISLQFSLEGPTPWRAKGYGKIEILFFTFKARFDRTWGENQNTALPPIEVMPILEKEFNNNQNWQAITQISYGLLVSMRDISGQSSKDNNIIVLHPLGSIKVSQRAVPLEKEIDLVGSQKPSDAKYFDLVNLVDFLAWGDIVYESFAPAQFFTMKASEKLSKCAFEKYEGGRQLIVKNGQTKTGLTTVRHVRYELITIDTAFKRAKKQFHRGIDALFERFLTNNAATKSALSDRRKKDFQPFTETINTTDGNYVVANTMNNTLYEKAPSAFLSQTEAEAFIVNEINNDPLMTDKIHVIPSSEVNIEAA
jgi:hypothetical protein